ncbi:hypothetical protein PHYPSEUDO_013601 [Phytophthora pseudosyringae]|uniref:Transmembrane protein n=1 Tax=Phytophthora pseudosyringae TaxID=221518 RepID=A0A8T1W6L4_9STRA|nr:hypothetical protein PHYPSEUDO_013601 [Phytophthora pseudosyringae]
MQSSSTCRSAAPSRTRQIRLALDAVGRVLRNSVLCVAIGWLCGYCFTLGNLFAGQSPGQQSIASFSAANIGWFWGIFSACMITIMSTKLLPEQFVDIAGTRVGSVDFTTNSHRKLNLPQCIQKVVVPMTPHLALAAVGAVGGDFVVYSLMPTGWRCFKPILYISAFWGFYILVVADVYARRIFQTETVRGLTRRQVDHEKRHRWYWPPSFDQILRVYRHNLPLMAFPLIAIVYVHVHSQFIGGTGRWGLLAFACISIILRLMLQELAKHLMLAMRRPVPRRYMVALVSTPTILVDTQVRMLLLQQDNVNVSVAGTVLFAVFEVIVRVVKSVIAERQTRGPPLDLSRRRSTSANLPRVFKPDHKTKSVQVLPAAKAKPTDREVGETKTRSRHNSMELTSAEVEERRRKRRILHAAEIYADMYAEYIALGCSYAILFFYRSHPQFEFTIFLTESSDQASSSTAGDAMSQEQSLMLLGSLQMSVEVVVDFLASALEAAQGVEFTSINQNDPFLIFFLAMLTFSNVAISAGMYMR